MSVCHNCGKLLGILYYVKENVTGSVKICSSCERVEFNNKRNERVMKK